jgi:hypothetical protein
MASISFVASSTIAAMIIRSDKGLCTPYSRIIFGLSIADIMQSLGIVISPLAAPSGTLDAPWAMGSTGSCSAIGFLLNVGGLAVPFYTLFLTHYFLQRVKYKLTPAQFARKMECRITTCIWLFPAIGGLVGLVNGYFNPGPGGSVCVIIDKPLSCSIDPKTYGDCVRGQNAYLASSFLLVLPFLLSFAMVIINLARFTFHVYQQEQMFKPTNQEPTSGSDGEGRIRGTSSAANVETIPDEGSSSASLVKQALVQSSLYIASFIICYVAPVISFIVVALRIPSPAWTFWFTSIFWPLGGFFNILIYTRPKVSRYKDSNPEYSRLHVFLIIVLSGGEVPTEIDFGDNQNDFTTRCNRENEFHADKVDEDVFMQSDLDSMPSARVKSQDSCYKEVLEIESFALSSLSYSRDDKEHSYGTEVVLSVQPSASLLEKQHYEDEIRNDFPCLTENQSGNKEIHGL